MHAADEECGDALAAEISALRPASALPLLSTCCTWTNSHQVRRGFRVDDGVRCRNSRWQQLHVAFGVTAVLVDSSLLPSTVDPPRVESTTANAVRHMVFLAPQLLPVGGGGGGGGNQQPEPIRRAQGIGSDPITLRTRPIPAKTVPVPTAVPTAAVDLPSVPSLVLDAIPMASRVFEQVGLPSAAMLSGTSTGPGSGGGVGTGRGTGIGSGRGPGLGAGSGGGTGGGVYRPGGAVSAPRVIKEVKPRYTTEALQHMIQGTVVLEVIVTRDGCPSQLRVVQTLDRGLDEQAVMAVTQWRFEPGQRAGAPVDVFVTIMLDFSIR